MTQLTLGIAQRMIDAALAQGNVLKLAPLTVVVVDKSGHLKALQRDDGATFLRPQIALAKAWGSVALAMSSRSLAGVAEQRPDFMNALIGIADGKIMPVPGGVLICDRGANILGAVGVSGDLSDQDERCAIAGIESVGLVAKI